MQVLVIAGGLGAGKSAAAEMLRAKGAVTLDLDAIARAVLAPGSPPLAHVAEAFGDVLLADGSLDRAALARAAFATREGAARLDAIVHPAVAREVGPALTELRLMPQPPEVVALEVPLLAEAPLYRELADVVVALVAPVEVRVARAVARGMAEEDARRRIAVQATDAERAALADVVIVNDGSLGDLERKVDEVWASRVMGGSRP